VKIAVINSGSSSIKFQLFDMPQGEVLAHILIESIGKFSSEMTCEFGEKKVTITSVVADHHEGLENIIAFLKEYEILHDFSALDAIGHRVVHGEEAFVQSTLIDEHVIAKIKELIPLAPLHNPANLEGILSARKKAPLVPQVAVFDTAFHATMPKEAYMYALESAMYEEHKIRRYGFHGSSHAYVLAECAKYLQCEPSALNIITLHLGNGSSACAIKNGKSVDTSMGFTPLEGLIMGSRSGDIDPAIVLYMQRELGMSVDEIDTSLNKKSGLLGICGHNDVRTILEHDDEKSKLALEMMSRSVKKYIGAYMALLGSVDAIVFTGGIGEHALHVREKIMEDMPCNIVLDRKKNSANERIISSVDSSVKIMIIPTDEELYIAQESLRHL